MSCAKSLTSNCAALGVVVGEFLPAFVTGGVVGLASAGAKGARAASGFLKSSRAGKNIADKLKALPGPQGVNIDETIKMLAFRPGEKWIVEDLKSAENLLNQFRRMVPNTLAKLSSSERELFNYLSERLPNYLQSARGERVEGVTKLAKKVEPIDPASPGSSIKLIEKYLPD
jgi:hypothetical protein